MSSKIFSLAENAMISIIYKHGTNIAYMVKHIHNPHLGAHNLIIAMLILFKYPPIKHQGVGWSDDDYSNFTHE